MVSCTWSDVLPFAAMVMVQFSDIGAATISKAAMSKGVSSYVLAVYSCALGTIVLLPCFIFQKKVSLTFTVLGGQFVLGLIGSSILLLAFNGIKYSSPTLSSAMANLIPVFTFILAVIFRMEKLDLRRPSCQAKVLGSVVSVSGAFVVILYKGSVIFTPPNSPEQHLGMILLHQSRWIMGGLMLAMMCFLNATWGIVQTSFVRNSPSVITIIFLYSFFVTIHCTIFSLIIEKTPNAWVITPDIELICIVYQGLFGSLLHVGVQTWCLHQKGPIFVAMFRPLGVAIAAVMVVIFLGDALHLGSVIGSIIIAVGFYAVMWAQIKEKSSTLVAYEVQSLAPSSSQKTPLLQCITSGEDV